MMRNLFRILLVSSALVAVSAPSAYATPQQEAAAAIGGDVTVLATLITPASAGFANLGTATAICNGNKVCVTTLLAAYAQAGFTPTAAQLTAIAAGANVTFTTAELGQYAIGATGPATTTTAAPPAGSGIGEGTGTAGSEAPTNAPSSTGTPGSAT